MKIQSLSFVRVSTREQAEEGYSLQAQEKLVKEYADNNNFLIVKIFSVPESASGKQERKLFNELLDYLNIHTEIQIVICEKVDRITRNFKDAVKLDEWLNVNDKRQIHFVKQSLIIHKNAKSSEKFMWDIYLVMARQYSNNLSEETKKGLDEKASQGIYPGSLKRGYKSIGDVGRKSWVVDDSKQEAKFIAMAFSLYATGNYTLRTLSKELFEQGWTINGKSISTSELHKLIIDPFYYGDFLWKGNVLSGRHTPIVSKELFSSVQDRLQRKIKAGKYRKHSFLFGGGLLLCGECGYSITAETQKGHSYYHCTGRNKECNQKKYIREEEIEKQVINSLDDFKMNNPKLFEWVRKALKETHKDESKYHEETVAELDKQYLKIKSRLDLLYEDRLDLVITKEQYEIKKEQYEDQMKDILNAKSNHAKANLDFLQLGSSIFELSQKGREIYENYALPNEKRELLGFIYSNLKIRDGKVFPSLNSGFDIVASRAKDGNWLPGMDSNHNKRIQSPLSYH